MDEPITVKNNKINFNYMATIDIAEQAVDVFRHILKTSHKNIMIEMSRVEDIDYCFIQLFYSFLQSVLAQDKTVQLVSFSKKVEEAFHLSGIKVLANLCIAA